MTPNELRELAAVMRELGVFKLCVEGVTIEMSQHAIVAGAAEAMAKAAPAKTETPTEPAPPAGDEDDPMTYAATEGLPTG